MKQNKIKSATIRSEIGILATIALFYMSSCGSERLFQTLEFTFGLCGPLHMTSKEAVVTDDCYNGGFFFGRLASILAVKLMRPKLMLKLSLALCAISTTILSLKADDSSNLLYACTALFGFAISWQFGSAFSWSAQFMDVVGWRASIFTIGCSFAFVAPLIGAYLFHRWAPMLVWHFNLVQVLVQIIAFLRLHTIFGQCDQNKENVNYKELKQEMDEINLSSGSSDEEYY